MIRIMRILWLIAVCWSCQINWATAQKNKTSPADGGRQTSQNTATDKDSNANPAPKITISDTSKVIIKREKNKLYSQMDTVYRQRIKMAQIDGVYIPKDLNDCFRELDKLMEQDVREKFMAFSDEEADKRTHGSLGMWIDHKWSLTEGSRLSHYFNQMRVPHPDYMVGIIITSYHRYLHKRDIKLKEQVEHFRKLWQTKQRANAKAMLKAKKDAKDAAKSTTDSSKKTK